MSGSLQPVMYPSPSSSSCEPLLTRAPNKRFREASPDTTRRLAEPTKPGRTINIGFDYGTKYTVVAVTDCGDPMPLAGFQGERKTYFNTAHVPTDVCYPLERTRVHLPSKRVPDGYFRLVKGEKPYTGWLVSGALEREYHKIHQWTEGRISNPKSILEPPAKEERPIEKRERIDATDRTIRLLKRAGAIKAGNDVIYMYTVAILDDVHRMVKEKYGVARMQDVQFAFSYPLTWNAKSCRQFEATITRALEESKFECPPGNIFLLHEPEAAMNAICQDLPDGIVIKDDMIIAIADIGAGTSDCVPYMVKCGTYIRPVEEVCEPRGISVGANDINTIVNSVLKSRLASQKQLDDPYNNVSRDSVRESFMTRFEDSMKSGIDLVSEELRWWVPGAVSICITVEEQKKLFVQQVFAKIVSLIVDMTSSVRDKGKEVDYWILTGGGSNLGVLRSMIYEGLNQMSTPFEKERVFWSKHTNGGCPDVAKGLVLRLLKSDPDPIHIFRTSVGVIRHYVTEDKNDPRAEPRKPVRLRADGLLRVMNTIAWKICKGDKDVKPFRWISQFTFPASAKELIGTEQVMVSDEPQEVVEDERCHYYKGHEKNKGAEYYGEVAFDMTKLLTDRKVEVIDPAAINKRGHPHYCIDLNIEANLVGRNWKFTGHWPAECPAQYSFQGSIPVASLLPAGT